MKSSFWNEFIPKSYLYLRHRYSKEIFKKDLIAGLTVGVIALPLAMAFAIASGATPEQGIITAIIAGFFISVLGGSRVQIGGPTGAFVVIIYGIIQRNGYEGLAICTVIAAIFMIAMGLLKLGSWVKFVPHPLVTGFTTGIAVIIFSSQIRDFFGLNMKSVPANFYEKWISYFQAFPTFDWPTTAMGIGSLAFILLIRRFLPKVPWGIATIVVATVIYLLFDLPIQTIATRFGELPHSLPIPELPRFVIPFEKIQEYFFDGFTIAFLGSIEALLSAVIADGMIGGRHKSNCELFGQGISNFASVLFGGLPATGAIARTAANVKTGAQTPVAGMIHAAVLFIIILLFSNVVSQIPLATLAAVLIIIAWNMSEVHHFRALLKAPRGDVAILLTAFLLTVFVDITFAIAIGMIIAMFVFVSRMSEYSKMTNLFKESGGEFPETADPESISKQDVPKNVEVYEISGPFFFGTADILQETMNSLQALPKVFILRLRKVPVVDASGMHAIREFYERCQKLNIDLILCDVNERPALMFKKFGIQKLVGASNICPHIRSALHRAEQLLS